MLNKIGWTIIKCVFMENEYVDYVNLTFLNRNMASIQARSIFTGKSFIIIKSNAVVLYLFTMLNKN